MAPYTLPNDAVWFITGCSSGIGLALATYLSTVSSTTRIVATARKPSTLDSLPNSPNVLKLALDVTNEESIQLALKETLAKFGRIDVLVNNAGYNILAEGETVAPDAARNLMDTNFWGAVRLTQLVLPIFREQNAATGQKGGVILQVTSLGGRLAFAGNSFYHASKFALEGWTEAIAKEMLPDWNIHFSCVEPGGVKTNYAHNSLVTAESGAQQHSAYADPNSPTNLLRKYHENPQLMANFAEPEAVVKAIYEFVQRGELPLRLPLGADSWGVQKKGLEANLKRLEVAKPVALSVSKNGEEQLKSIEFLEV
jgi:NAD(P)-dependent dehydrogenase (short-subunit alcohol dehydrogenase family)